MKTLIGSDHPYYAQEGNFFRNGLHHTFDSWSAFLEDFGDCDEDLNLVYRWDWRVTDPNDIDDDETEEDKAAAMRPRVKIFFIGQRKAKCWSAEAIVTDADEPAVRAWLEKRWERMKRLWAPFSDVDVVGGAA